MRRGHFTSFAVLAVCAFLTRASLAELILSVEPVPGQSINGNTTVVLEVFLANTGPDFFVRGIQVDLPCVLPGGTQGEIATQPVQACTNSTQCPVGAACVVSTGTCNSVSVGNASSSASGSIPWLFAPQGFCIGGSNPGAFCLNNSTCRGGGQCDTTGNSTALRPVAQAACRFSAAPGPGESEYRLPSNNKRYVGTVRYAVSECAAGAFQTQFEVANHPPLATDLTRILNANNVAVEFTAVNPSIVVATGRCCEDHVCLGDVNSVCCAAISGGDGLFRVGRTCANGCDCPLELDGECDDGLFCSGIEHCNLGTCVAGSDPCVSAPMGPLCNEATNTCVRCLSADDCPVEANPCRLATCAAGSCTVINAPQGKPCDDGLFCTTADQCVAGACVGSPGVCPAQMCDESGDRCVECLGDEECDDGDLCTDDVCTDGSCRSDPNLAPCDDGIPCTGGDFCAAGACRSGADACGAQQLCDRDTGECVSDPCPISMLLGLSPPAKTIDARQPHGVNDDSLAGRQGIGGINEPISIRLNVGAASPGCFTLCEAASDPTLGPNVIVDVLEAPPRTYVITLARPVTPGVDTSILYRGEPLVTYTSLPGNVNASSIVNTNDALSLVAYFRGESTPPYDLFSVDVNHSGAADAADLVETINLLTGAGTQDVWLGVVLAPPPTCP